MHYAHIARNVPAPGDDKTSITGSILCHMQKSRERDDGRWVAKSVRIAKRTEKNNALAYYAHG
jgi:hypothetical protein